MFNLFKKNKSSDDLNFVQRLAMKRFESMSEEEKMKMMQKMLTPENIAKNKDKIMAVMEQMKNSGQIPADQLELVKQKLGL
jgi:hypothetical protein